MYKQMEVNMLIHVEKNPEYHKGKWYVDFVEKDKTSSELIIKEKIFNTKDDAEKYITERIEFTKE